MLFSAKPRRASRRL